MKKRLAVFGLGLRLTWMAVLGILMSVCGLQSWLFWRQRSVWGGVEFDMGYRIGLEQIIENDGIRFVGTYGALLLLGVLVLCIMNASSDMTLRRLRIPEWEVALWWSVLFSGYFLIYWAAQLGMLLWMFRIYSDVSGWSTMDLFITAHTSPYFHMVLPLSEPWAVARNIFLCVGSGVLVAVNGLEARRGGKPFMLFVFWFLVRLFAPNDMATQVADMASIAVLGGVLIAYIVTVRGSVKNED